MAYNFVIKEIMEHRTYSRDLAPSDWLKTQGTGLCWGGIVKLLLFYGECLERVGDFIEKELVAVILNLKLSLLRGE